MKHYLILSEGAYSDYSPQYFVGDNEITQAEFDAKGVEVGDRVIAEYKAAPERAHIHTSEYCCTYGKAAPIEKYNPTTGKALSYYPSGDDWMAYMKAWVLEQGFEPLPDNIPELNTQYSEFPSSRNV